MLIYLLCIYLIFIFRYFKTNISINHPFELFFVNNTYDYLKHSLNHGKYESKICKFGQDNIFLLVIFLILRKKYKKIHYLSPYVLAIVFCLSLLNMNAVIYLIPYFIHELVFF